MSEITKERSSIQNQPKVKKTDYFFRIIFYPFFLLPRSFTPNHVSYMRLFMSLPICILIFMNHFILAGFVFILAALLDGLDGAMARIRKQITDDGEILDPITDKVLNIPVFIYLINFVENKFYPWIILPIVVIDLVLLFIAIGKFKSKSIKVDKTGANNWGKTKMVIQIIVLSAMLLFDPNAGFFLHNKLILPFNMVMLDFFWPLLIACIFLGSLSLWGHLKVVHIKQKHNPNRHKTLHH